MKFFNRILILSSLFFINTKGYDFTNFIDQQKQLQQQQQQQQQIQITPKPILRNNERIVEGNSSQLNNGEKTIIPQQTPISLFFSKLYGLKEGEMKNEKEEEEEEIRETKLIFNLTESNLFKNNGKGINLTGLIEEIQEESIKYNVSFLGLNDPFERYSTKLSYDYTIDIGEPRNNGKGSIVSLLNGTIFPLGSVGAMSALGWRGGKNETLKQQQPASPPQQPNTPINATSQFPIIAGNSSTTANDTSSTNSTKSGNNTSSSSSSTILPPPPQDGLSGVWLAFTSQHALTGGYTLNAKQLSISNNALFHNVTFRSNFTIDSHGTFNFTFTFGVVDEIDQLIQMRKNQNSTTSSTTTTSTTANKIINDIEQDQPLINPIKLEGPHCVQLKGMNNSEAAFRLQCRGKKIHLFNDI